MRRGRSGTDIRSACSALPPVCLHLHAIRQPPFAAALEDQQPQMMPASSHRDGGHMHRGQLAWVAWQLRCTCGNSRWAAA